MDQIAKLVVDCAKMLEQRLPEYLDFVADYLPESLVSSIKTSLNEKMCMPEAEANEQVWKTIYYTTAAVSVPFFFLLYISFSRIKAHKRKSTSTMSVKEEAFDDVTESTPKTESLWTESSDDKLLPESYYTCPNVK